MRTCVGLVALLLGLALTAPARAQAQDASYYWPETGKVKKRTPPPPPTFTDKVKTFTAKAVDYNTYLPKPGTTQNTIEDPRLLPNATPSHVLVDLIDYMRPKDIMKFIVP